MRHILYQTLTLFVFYSQAVAQSITPACPTPPPPGAESCEATCIYCDFDGHMGINDGAPSGGNIVCGQIQIHNDQWFGFIAGSTSITIDVITSNCSQGNGLQLAIFGDCGDPDALVCNPGCGGCGDITMSITYDNFEIGQTYYLMIDGWTADVCDYEIDVVDGSITPPSPEFPDTPSGPTQMCPGGTGVYSIPPAFGAGFYHWTAPVGASINGGGNTISVDADYGYQVTVTFGNVGGQVCVAAANPCSGPTPHACLNVNVSAIPTTQLPPAIICNEWLPYVWDLPPYPELTTPGTYHLNSLMTSYLGCDSLVRQTVIIKSPIFTSLGLRRLCAGECLQVGGQSFCQPGDYSIALLSYLGCDSVVVFRLEYLDPKGEIIGPDRFYCEMDSILLKAPHSASEKTWTNGLGQTLAVGDSLLVYQPGVYILRSSITDGTLTCVQSDNISITDDSLTILVQIGIEGNLCGQDSVRLTGQANVASPTFDWYGSNGFHSSLQNPVVYDTGQYVLIVATQEGCLGTDTVNLTSIGIPPDVIATGGALSCPQAQVVLQGISSFQDVTYHWSGPNGFQSDEQNTATDVPGVYTLTATLSNGCSMSDTAVVSQLIYLPEIVVDSLVHPSGGQSNGAFYIHVANNPGNLSYTWYSGGQVVGTTEDLVNVPAGDYSLVITDSLGCTTTANFSLAPALSVQNAPLSSWKVQPNPNTGRFSLRRSKDVAETARLQIQDAFGRLVLEQSVDANASETFVDLQESPAGWYFLYIDTEQGRRTEKILVQR